MQTRCKQGDIAICVRSYTDNLGKIYQCLELVITDRVPMLDGTITTVTGGTQPMWRVDKPVTWTTGKKGMYQLDKNLRPLRGDLNDETIETTKENERETENI